jgi:hypothetical protein
LERCVYDYRVKNATRVTCGLKTRLRPKSKNWHFCTGQTRWLLFVMWFCCASLRPDDDPVRPVSDPMID